MKNILYGILLFLCISCSTTKTIYVPVETLKTEYINSFDSIYVYDSVYYSLIQQRDTIYEKKYIYKVLQKYQTDTLVVRDSIPVIKEVEKIVEVNRLTWWQKVFSWIGGISSILCLSYIFSKILKR